jgi:hypothetical protein
MFVRTAKVWKNLTQDGIAHQGPWAKRSSFYNILK